MTPLKLSLEGSLGIKAGLGRDTFEFDFSSIPDEAVIVAFKGENGTGKSTLINFMTPFLDPPWLSGGAYSQFGPVGVQELEWSHAGKTYRSRIEYKNKSRRAYLHQGNGVGGWEPVHLQDFTVSDGKVGTYTKCVEHIVGPAQVYALSAFRAQGAPKLAEYSDPKSLMRDLLSLDEPAKLSELSRDVARGLRRTLDAMRNQVAALDAIPAHLAELGAAATALAAGVPALSSAKLSAMAAVSRAHAELDRAMAGDIDQQRLLDQRQAVSARLAGARNSGAAAIRQAEQAHSEAQKRLAAAISDRDSTIRTIENDIAAAERRASGARATLESRAAVEDAYRKISDLTGRIAKQEQTTDLLHDQLYEMRQIVAAIQIMEAQREHAYVESRTLFDRVDELTARVGYIAVVPCRGTGIYAECPSLREAYSAKKLVGPARQAADKKRDEWCQISTRIGELSKQTANLNSVAAAHGMALDILGELRAKVESLRPLTKGESALALADQNLADAQKAIAELKQRRETAEVASAAETASLKQAVAESCKYLDATKSRIAAKLDSIQAELDALPEPGTGQAVAMANDTLSAAEANMQAAHSAVDAQLAAVSRCQAEIRAQQAALESGAAMIAKARRLETEFAEWSLLASGLSGVIDLVIESSGPSIADIANDLLATVYGSRFTVKIVTQFEQANGKIVECFHISVIDSESGIESSILQKSGGESVILDRCLTDAVSLFQQDEAGIQYEVTMADEADGALSEENSRLFHQMERRAMVLGQYHRKYFVSHRPESWDMADFVIDLEEYRL